MLGLGENSNGMSGSLVGMWDCKWWGVDGVLRDYTKLARSLPLLPGSMCRKRGHAKGVGHS